MSAAVTGKIDALVQSVMSGAQKSIEVAIYLAGIMACNSKIVDPCC